MDTKGNSVMSETSSDPRVNFRLVFDLDIIGRVHVAVEWAVEYHLLLQEDRPKDAPKQLKAFFGQ
jgi:hypothetical protein